MVAAILALGFLGSLAVGVPRASSCSFSVVQRGDSEAAWSPDGREVAFVHRTSRWPAGIFVRDLQTHAVIPFAQGEAPEWSPDGGSLAFSSLVPYTLPAGSPTCDAGPTIAPETAWESDLLTAPFNGTQSLHAANITHSVPDAESPIGWLRNGRIAFRRRLSSGSDLVATMRFDGSDVRVLNLPWHDPWGGPPSAIAWSPTGERVAFVTDLGIEVAKTNGSARALVLADGGPANDLAWSPDGRQIAFAEYGSVKEAGVYVMNSDGSDARRVALGTEPSWSPDGHQLVYAHAVAPRKVPISKTRWRYVGGGTRIYIKDLRSTQPGVPLR